MPVGKASVERVSRAASKKTGAKTAAKAAEAKSDIKAAEPVSAVIEGTSEAVLAAVETAAQKSHRGIAIGEEMPVWFY